MRRLTILCLSAVLALGGASARAQEALRADPQATAALAILDGVWIGPARMMARDGGVSEFEQMERIGPMLGGEIRVMEGESRGPDGRRQFNAFTVFSAAEGGGLEMRSHIPGHESVRVIEPKPDGYVWRTAIPEGVMVYDITINDGVWTETGVIEFADGRRIAFFEMTLRRVGDTDWPAANPDFETLD